MKKEDLETLSSDRLIDMLIEKAIVYKGQIDNLHKNCVHAGFGPSPAYEDTLRRMRISYLKETKPVRDEIKRRIGE